MYLPGADPVFGFYHTTRDEVGRGLDVLICTPFGWGEAHSYRSRRNWAIQLAAAGYPTLRIDLASINGEPGFILREGDRAAAVLMFELEDDRISTVRVFANPDKLRHIARESGQR